MALPNVKDVQDAVTDILSNPERMQQVMSQVSNQMNPGEMSNLFEQISPMINPELINSVKNQSIQNPDQMKKLMAKSGMNRKKIQQLKKQVKAVSKNSSTGKMVTVICITASRDIKTRDIEIPFEKSLTTFFKRPPMSMQCTNLNVGPWINNDMKIYYGGNNGKPNRKVKQLIGHKLVGDVFICGNNSITVAEFNQVLELIKNGETGTAHSGTHGPSETVSGSESDLSDLSALLRASESLDPSSQKSVSICDEDCDDECDGH